MPMFLDDSELYICSKKECKSNRFICEEIYIVKKEDLVSNPNHYNILRAPEKTVEYRYKCIECDTILQRGVQ